MFLTARAILSEKASTNLHKSTTNGSSLPYDTAPFSITTITITTHPQTQPISQKNLGHSCECVYLIGSRQFDPFNPKCCRETIGQLSINLCCHTVIRWWPSCNRAMLSLTWRRAGGGLGSSPQAGQWITSCVVLLLLLLLLFLLLLLLLLLLSTPPAPAPPRLLQGSFCSSSTPPNFASLWNPASPSLLLLLLEKPPQNAFIFCSSKTHPVQKNGNGKGVLFSNMTHVPEA